MLFSNAVLFSLATAALALPAPSPDETLISRIGGPLHAESLEKRATACTSTFNCRAMPAMTNGRAICKNSICVYACRPGFTYQASTGTCSTNTQTPRGKPAALSTSATPDRSTTTPAGSTTTTSRPPMITTTSAQATTTPRATTTTTPTTSIAAAPSSTPLTADESAALVEHNRFRALHGAVPLVWDNAAASAARTWASRCVFEHSRGAVGNYGENLAATAGQSSTVVQQIKLWEDESVDYDPTNPIYSHFTQMVWKSTIKLGCAFVSCPNGSIFDPRYSNTKYLVCEYSEPGNAGGPDNYRKNVQP